MHRLHVTFIDKDGKKYTYEVSEGDNLLDIAQENDLEMEGMLEKLLPNSHELVPAAEERTTSGISPVVFFWSFWLWKTPA